MMASDEDRTIDEIDRLLSAAIDQLEPLPAELPERVGMRIRHARRRRVAIGGMATACAIACGAVAIEWTARFGPLDGRGTEAVSKPSVVDDAIHDRRVVVASSRKTTIVRPVQSDLDNVSIYWFHPAISPPHEDSDDHTNQKKSI